MQVIVQLIEFVDGWSELEAFSDVGLNVLKVKIESPQGLHKLLIIIFIFMFYQTVENAIDNQYDNIENF